MNRNEQVRSRSVGGAGALVEGHECVGVAREPRLDALRPQLFGEPLREIQHEIFLEQTRWAARAVVVAAVAGVDHHAVEALLRRAWGGARQCRRERQQTRERDSSHRSYAGQAVSPESGTYQCAQRTRGCANFLAVGSRSLILAEP